MKLLTFLLLSLAVATPTDASPILYEFAGKGGLSGQFFLDDEAAWQVTVSEYPSREDTTVLVESPLQTIWGSYGEMAFSGTVALHMYDGLPNIEFPVPDYWIVRAELGNGLRLNLFNYMPASRSPLSLDPPPSDPSAPGFSSLSYSIYDGSSWSASDDLTTLKRVPEPATVLLLLAGFASLRVCRRWQSHSSL
jgi:hypothetical protein